MKKYNSQFKDWFEAQHGKYPSDLSLSQLQNEVAELRQKLGNISWLLKKCELYEAQRKSALYAWTARDKL